MGYSRYAVATVGMQRLQQYAEARSQDGMQGLEDPMTPLSIESEHLHTVVTPDSRS